MTICCARPFVVSAFWEGFGLARCLIVVLSLRDCFLVTISHVLTYELDPAAHCVGGCATRVMVLRGLDRRAKPLRFCGISWEHRTNPHCVRTHEAQCLPYRLSTPLHHQSLVLTQCSQMNQNLLDTIGMMFNII